MKVLKGLIIPCWSWLTGTKNKEVRGAVFVRESATPQYLCTSTNHMILWGDNRVTLEWCMPGKSDSALCCLTSHQRICCAFFFLFLLFFFKLLLRHLINDSFLNEGQVYFFPGILQINKEKGVSRHPTAMCVLFCKVAVIISKAEVLEKLCFLLNRLILWGRNKVFSAFLYILFYFSQDHAILSLLFITPLYKAR